MAVHSPTLKHHLEPRIFKMCWYHVSIGSLPLFRDHPRKQSSLANSARHPSMRWHGARATTRKKGTCVLKLILFTHQWCWWWSFDFNIMLFLLKCWWFKPIPKVLVKTMHILSEPLAPDPRTRRGRRFDLVRVRGRRTEGPRPKPYNGDPKPSNAKPKEL